jgi:ankyrin repeat protein
MSITVILAALLIAGGAYFFLSKFLPWYGIYLPGSKPEINTVYDAVYNKDQKSLERLITEGADVNKPDYRGEAPILAAAVTDQFQMVELLIGSGANIYAVDSLGYNVGIYASTSHVQQSTTEDIARNRVIEKLKDRGFPWPPPWPDDVLRMIKENNWPPHNSSN